MAIDRSIIHPSVKIHHKDLVNIYDAIVDENTSIASFVEIGGSRIGKRCKIQAFAFIPNGTWIMDDVFIGPHACFCNVKYPRAFNDRKHEFRKGSVDVGNGVTIGANATILPGIKIGSGAVVGAGSVVTKDVEAGSIVYGNPAVHTGYIGDTWQVQTSS